MREMREGKEVLSEWRQTQGLRRKLPEWGSKQSKEERRGAARHAVPMLGWAAQRRKGKETRPHLKPHPDPRPAVPHSQPEVPGTPSPGV